MLVAAALLVGGCQSTAPSNSPSPSPTHAAAATAAQATAAPASPRASNVASPSQVAADARPVFGALPDAKLDAGRVAALQHVLDAAVAAGAPDVIAAVITPEGTWAGAAGTGGPDGRKATIQDEFAIGSVGKTFVDTLVMRLVEQGRIDLDAPIARYLGSLAIDTNGATVRQALGGRTGIPDIDAEAAAEAISADPAHRWTLEDTLAELPKPTSPPGPYASALSNSLMLILAVEHVTNGSFDDALRAEVLDPVGAARIVAQGYGVPTPKPWALPTEAHLGRFKLADLGAGGAISCIASATASHGVGGLAADAPSLAAWAWHLLAGDIVEAPSLTAMLPAADGHGFGLDRLAAPLDRAIGMPGSKTGYGTVLAIMPAEQTVAVVLVNDEEFRIDPYIVDLIDAATAR